MATNNAPYKKGSLAELRAQRAKKKQESDNKNNILIKSNPIPEKISSDADTLPQTKPKHHQQNSGYIDKFGFVRTDEEKKEIFAEIGTDGHRNVIRKQNERIYKWLHMLDNWETYTTTKRAKLKSRIRKGIPTALRAKVWKKIMGVSELTKQEKHYYSKLRFQSPTKKFKTSIDNDLDRTFPRHILFTKPDNEQMENGSRGKGRGKDSLKNVLYAYANHDTDVGYTQGMGFIAALFLMLMTEDDAFYCLCKLLDSNGDFAMRGLYLDGLPLLHMRYFQFDQLLLKFMPKLSAHIHSFEITPEFYASKWFITIFCYEFPFEFVYRIWDVYLNEGIKSVFRVSLGLMKLNETSLLKLTDFSDMMKYVQSMHTKNEISINQLLHRAFDLPLKHEHLQSIEQAYNIKKLQEQRSTGQGRGGRRGRDASELEQPSFIKKMSKDTNHSNGAYTPDSTNENENNSFNNAVTPEPNDEMTEKIQQIIADSDEKKENGNEGSHSASSYVDEEPSSVLPNGNGNNGHNIIPPKNGHD